MVVFVLAFLHEHGNEINAFHEEKDALESAHVIINETLDELEDKIDDSEDATEAFDLLKKHLENKQIKDAIKLYNEIFVSFVNSSESHEISIKKCEVLKEQEGNF